VPSQKLASLIFGHDTASSLFGPSNGANGFLNPFRITPHTVIETPCREATLVTRAFWRLDKTGLLP
jgi:hypothetical protein